MSIINFNDYYQAKRLSQLDNENPIIHENMNTLSALLPDTSELELTDEFLTLADKINKLIQYDLPNASLLEKSTTRMVFLLKKEAERDHDSFNEKIEELQSISEEFLESNTQVNLMKYTYNQKHNKPNKSIFRLFNVMNFLAICSGVSLMNTYNAKWWAFFLMLSTLTATILFVFGLSATIVSAIEERPIWEVNDICNLSELTSLYSTYTFLERGTILVNPLVLIPIYLDYRHRKNLEKQPIYSNKAININTYEYNPKKVRIWINELSKYEVPEKYAIKLNEVIAELKQEGFSSSKKKALIQHMDYFVGGLELLSEQ